MPQIKLLNQYAQANPSTGCDRSDCCNNQLKKQQSRKRSRNLSGAVEQDGIHSFRAVVTDFAIDLR